MGIKNLHTFLRKTCPQIYEEVHLSEYAFKKIGIDTAIYLCKFKTSLGTQWLNGFLQICSLMREYCIHPVFIFDNVFPPEKEEEKKRRSDARKQQKSKMLELREEWNQYRSLLFHHDPSVLYCFMKDPNIPIGLYAFLFKTFISNNSVEEDFNHRITIADIDNEFIRIENTMLQIDPNDYQTVKNLLSVLKIPYITAIGEAEATGSYLCRARLLDAILTDDTDVLAYGCPVFLHKLDLHDHTCMRIQYSNVLETLDFDEDSFLDFCIMCGTDYNVNIPGIGHEKAFKWLKQHKKIEGILNSHPSLQSLVDQMDTTSSFMFNRVREMFSEEPEEEIIRRYGGRTLWCDFPDWDEVTAFLFYHNCSLTDITGLKNNLYNNRGLVFPDGDLDQDRDQDQDQQDGRVVDKNQPVAPKLMVLNQQKKCLLRPSVFGKPLFSTK